MDARTRDAASLEGGDDVQGRALGSSRATGRDSREAKRPDADTSARGGSDHSNGMERGGTPQPLAVGGVATAGTALPRGRADARRSALIVEVCRSAEELIERAAIAQGCRESLPIDGVIRWGLDRRLAEGDRLAIYDVIGETLAELTQLREAIAEVLVDDPAALHRLAELRTMKPRYGVLPVIDGGRQAGDRVTNQETAATDRGGKERPRSGRMNRKAPASQG